MDFSERLKLLRKEKKLRQVDVAEKLNVSDRAIRAYEGGKMYPAVDSIIALADLFSVSVDYLLGRTDDPNASQMTTEAIVSYLETLPTEELRTTYYDVLDVWKDRQKEEEKEQSK